MSIPTDPNALLLRDRLAEALTEAGYPIKPKTLATKATRGGGPPYSRFGLRALYRWGGALAWAEARLTAPRRSTSEHDAIDGEAGSGSGYNVGSDNPEPSLPTRSDTGSAP
jgi:hypothetical protein